MKREDNEVKNTLKPTLLLVWLIAHRRLSKRDILENLGIKPRTLKKYIIELNKLLRSGKIELFNKEKSDKNNDDKEEEVKPVIKEVKYGDKKYLELIDFNTGYAMDCINEVVMLYIFQSIFSTLQIKYFDSIGKNLFQNRLNSLKGKFDIKSQLDNLNILLYYHPYAPKDYSSKEDIIKTIVDCIISRKKMECKYLPLYSDKQSTTSFLLKPYTLVIHQNALYLLGEDENGNIKTYSVDRFISVKRKGDEYYYPSDYNPKNYLNDYIGIIGSSERFKFEIIFKNNPMLHKVLTERSWFRNQFFEKLPDGRLKMTFNSCDSIELQRWIYSWGRDIDSFRKI